MTEKKTSGGRLRGLGVCMLTSAHAPDDDRIFFKEARTLARAGAAVTIVCPSGEQHPNTNGVTFLRFPSKKRLLGRLWNVRALARIAEQVGAMIIHCHEPDSLVAALMVRKRMGTRVVYDSHELWSGVAGDRLSLGGETVARAFRLVEERFVRDCDAAIGATPGITRFLSGVLGAARVVTILNVPSEEVFGAVERASLRKRVVFAHDGHLTFDRGLIAMAEAFREVASHFDAELRIVGDVFGEERVWLDDFVKRNRLEGRITKTGWLPYEGVGRALADCDVGLVGFRKLRNHEVAAPNKFFNYLYAGLPILAPSFMEFARSLSAESEGCILYDEEGPRSLARQMAELAGASQERGALSARAIEASELRYRWSHMESTLIGLYERVLGRNRADRVTGALYGSQGA